MRDHAIEKIWESLNEEGEPKDEFKVNFFSDCKKYGLLVAIFNLGFLVGSSE